ncbi:universal stress protein [Streptomyces poriticola]|uniref:universal stress protein n=1 Tax=Streptomyces poriticola TaxID=3120506 RepID=UPI002FCE5775
MPGRVVVGVDESDESLAAADWAGDEAAFLGAELLLVNASLWQVHVLVAVVPARDEREGQAAGLLDAAEARVKERHPGVPTTRRQIEDAPSKVLLSAASDADLLVLGSRRLGAGEGFVLGSVAQEVVAAAAGPVVLVRRRQAAGLADGGRVVVGVDVRHDTGELLGFAFDAAARREVSLHLVTTWHLPFPHLAEQSAVQNHEEALAAAVQPFRERFPQVRVSWDAEAGRAVDHLVSSASGAGLLVIGNRRRAGAGAHIGAVAHGVIHHAPCPVAVVPHG